MIKNNLIISTDTGDYNYLDYNFLVITNKSNQGIGDCVGRTAKVLVFYGGVDKYGLAVGIRSTFKEFEHSGHGRKKDRNFYRHYVYNPAEMGIPKESSRDHIIMGLAGLVITGYEKDFVKKYISSYPRRASESYRFTMAGHLWFRAIDSKTWSVIYAIQRTPRILFAALGNFIIERLFFIKKYKNLIDFHCNRRKANKLQQFVGDNLRYKTYASIYSLFAANAIKGKGSKKWVKFLLRSHFEKTNYFGLMFAGKKYSETEVRDIFDNYIPTNSYMWSETLDICNKRSMTLKPEDTAFNNVEVGSLLGCYLNQYKPEEHYEEFNNYIKHICDEYAGSVM